MPDHLAFFSVVVDKKEEAKQGEEEEEAVGSIVMATFERDGGRPPIAAGVEY
jgi:hypothetical protein